MEGIVVCRFLRLGGFLCVIAGELSSANVGWTAVLALYVYGIPRCSRAIQVRWANGEAFAQQQLHQPDRQPIRLLAMHSHQSDTNVTGWTAAELVDVDATVSSVRIGGEAGWRCRWMVLSAQPVASFIVLA
jgi:hypothetical protein